MTAAAALAQPVRAGDAEQVAILDRHMEVVSRDEATGTPRSEADQAVVGGWPLYRTPVGQAAFNAAMATLAATDGPAPDAAAFQGCVELRCRLKLPAIGERGWLPAGRIWISPAEYVIFAQSPRREGDRWRRHDRRSMRYFVLHEFHNGSRNIDPYDTISSHGGAVFVPLYMSKSRTDAKGRRFVVVVQTAPYDVVSSHATNYGSAGPGIEVAKNVNEELEPLQALAGILVAAIIKSRAPQLAVVNHRGTEGLPMLKAWQRRVEAVAESEAPGVALPFVYAPASRLAAATARLDELVRRRGAAPPLPVAERTFVPRTRAAAAAPPTATGDEEEEAETGASSRSVSRASAEAEPVLVEPPRPAIRPHARLSR